MRNWARSFFLLTLSMNGTGAYAQSSGDLRSLNAWSGLGIMIGIVLIVIAAAGIVGLMLVKKSHELDVQIPPVELQQPPAQAVEPQTVAVSEPVAVQPPVVDVPAPAPAATAQVSPDVVPMGHFVPPQQIPTHPPTAAAQPPVIPPFTQAPLQSQPPDLAPQQQAPLPVQNNATPPQQPQVNNTLQRV